MQTTGPNLQPMLHNKLIIGAALQAGDFEMLFAAASDPLVWEQHPNPNRYQHGQFQNYFAGAMESGGALLVRDAVTNHVIGCSRYYDYNAALAELKIGYTFFKRSHWGGGYNYALKVAMLSNVFPLVNRVLFDVGAYNLRSQLSLERFGAVKIREENVAYHTEPTQPNFVYEITKEGWAIIAKNYIHLLPGKSS
ncbi:MAG: N-acetyltransferase [Chitinophagaceae bacterium]|nr:MAG: N-acetyltransferase [Chitinophagaceae bacterium]